MHVSVIMPTFNYGRFIGQAIESVLSQTHRNWELIIVDDGSTDDTSAVVSNFKDTRIRYARLENGGVSRARNHGLDLARGEALAFLDADDVWLPHKLEAQVRVLSIEPEVGFVACNFVRFKSDGTELSEQFHFMQRTVGVARHHSADGLYGVLPGNALVALCHEAEMPWYPPANLVRKSAVEDIRFPVGIRLGEDLHYFNRVWIRTRAALVDSVAVRVRVHDSNSSKNAASTHHQRTIDEFSSLLRLDLTAAQVAAVRRRIAIEWASVGWAARMEGRYRFAADAYAEACRSGGATWRMRAARIAVAGRALWSPERRR